MHTPDAEDLILWPDHTMCSRYELEEFQIGKSDDFMVIPFESPQWHSFQQFVDSTDFGGPNCICPQCSPSET